MRGVAQRQLRTSALGAHDEDYEGSRIGGVMANIQDDGTPEPIRIDVLSPHLASEAGDLLAASHADYPSFTHLFPDPPRRRRVLRPFMSAAARDAALHARAMAASDDNGIVGVALWMPQGTFPLSLWRKARMAPALLRAALSARGAFPAFARVGATLEKIHPRDRSWYLQAMGVHPRAQRRGVGRQLLPPHSLSPTRLACPVTCTPRIRRISRTTSASGSRSASLPSRCSHTDLTTSA